MRLADLPDPDTAATRAAAAVLHRYAGPAMTNHAIRAWYWAEALGGDLPHDPELLKVAALLHDLGLEEPFDSHRRPFEDAGGHLAWVFGAGAGWDAHRCDRLHEIVVRHMWDEVDPAADPESHLLERATGLDISGRGIEAWPADLRAEVLGRWPRLDLAERFTVCFTDQAERKPHSSAGAAIRGGLAARIAANPLES